MLIFFWFSVFVPGADSGAVPIRIRHDRGKPFGLFNR